MEKFYLEEASLERKDEAIEYIEEHFKYNSNIAGVSGLDDEYVNYEKWLEKLETQKDEKKSSVCVGLQYFLIRVNDNKIVGMLNLRWNLNEWMLTHGGHIGYGVRPTERRKGYNKINLYLSLLKAKELGIDNVLLTAFDNNPGSIKTIEALGGILENKIEVEGKDSLKGRYWINVDEAIEKYKNEYEKYIAKEKVR